MDPRPGSPPRRPLPPGASGRPGPAPLRAPAATGPAGPALSRRFPPARIPVLPPREWARAWAFFGVGLVTLPLLALGLVRNAVWVLAAIAHELGHTAAGWLAGSASIPRLAPGHYADTLIGCQSLVLAWVLVAVAAGLGWRAWRSDWPVGRRVAALGLLALYPLVIFTRAREVVFLWAGHGFELAFAGICLWRAFTGGFTESPAERGAYSVCGWALLGLNVGLFVGILFDRGARATYLAGSSSGWPNDLVRVASAWGWSLGAVAGLALVLALAVVPLAAWMGARSLEDHQRGPLDLDAGWPGSRRAA